MRIENNTNYLRNKEVLLAKSKERYKKLDRKKENERCRILYHKNRNHYLEKNMKYRIKHPETLRSYKLKTKYGISISEYEELYKSQNGKCFLCESKDNLCVDHNHISGKVRNILCKKCNTALGMVNDNSSLLRKMADYIERHLTPLAPDAGDSAASSGIVQASALSTSQTEPTPTQRG